jgi:hypothetical protein
VKKGPEKGKPVEVMKRKLDFENISHVSLSTLQVGGSCEGHFLYIRETLKDVLHLCTIHIFQIYFILDLCNLNSLVCSLLQIQILLENQLHYKYDIIWFSFKQ